MTRQDRTQQNKLCWSRIIELEELIREAKEEIGDLHDLITENMLKIAEALSESSPQLNRRY